MKTKRSIFDEFWRISRLCTETTVETRTQYTHHTDNNISCVSVLIESCNHVRLPQDLRSNCWICVWSDTQLFLFGQHICTKLDSFSCLCICIYTCSVHTKVCACVFILLRLREYRYYSRRIVRSVYKALRVKNVHPSAVVSYPIRSCFCVLVCSKIPNHSKHTTTTTRNITTKRIPLWIVNSSCEKISCEKGHNVRPPLYSSYMCVWNIKIQKHIHSKAHSPLYQHIFTKRSQFFYTYFKCRRKRT